MEKRDNKLTVCGMAQRMSPWQLPNGNLGSSIMAGAFRRPVGDYHLLCCYGGRVEFACDGSPYKRHYRQCVDERFFDQLCPACQVILKQLMVKRIQVEKGVSDE